MKLFVLFLGLLFVFGVMNNSSLFFISCLLMGIYVIFSLADTSPSVSQLSSDSLTSGSSGFNLKVPENAIENGLKDLGKITKNLLTGNNSKQSTSKALMKGTMNTVEEAGSLFKK
jgi:hypothetical protein